MLDSTSLSEAANYIRNGDLVIFPTETVYGLGANGLDANAVERIYQAKGRPSANPVILHIAKESELSKLVLNVPEHAQRLIAKYWPGPLTFVLPKSEVVPEIVSAGSRLVAVRMPAHPMARELIRAAGVPIAAPSANISGRPSPTRFEDLDPELTSKVKAILNGGDCIVGLESTVVDLSRELPKVLRPGVITAEDIYQTLGLSNRLLPTGSSNKISSQFTSPGSKFKHYSPSTPIRLFELSADMHDKLNAEAESLLSQQKKIGVLATNQMSLPEGCVRIELGNEDDLLDIARYLFAALNQIDRLNLDIVLAPSFPNQGIGAAVMDRLRKAASS